MSRYYFQQLATLPAGRGHVAESTKVSCQSWLQFIAKIDSNVCQVPVLAQEQLTTA